MKKLKLEELNRPSVEEFKKQEKTPIVVVLDNVRSAHNVGATFRTSDAFAVEKIYLCGITPTPPHRDIFKTAIGAHESVEWQHEKEISTTVAQLKKEGYQVWAVEQTSDTVLLQNVDLHSVEKVALVFGNEVMGVSDSILGMIDGAVEVPQIGTKHSLNVSVCVGVVLWEVFKKMKL